MGPMIRRALAQRSPEELLLIPLVIIIGLAILAQPTAITRLFETPYATPIPGDSPADVIMNGRTPAPSPSPVTAPRGGPMIVMATRPFDLAERTGAVRCPSGSTPRETAVRYADGVLKTLRTCVGPDGSIVLWDTTTARLQVIPGPGTLARP